MLRELWHLDESFSRDAPIFAVATSRDHAIYRVRFRLSPPSLPVGMVRFGCPLSNGYDVP